MVKFNKLHNADTQIKELKKIDHCFYLGNNAMWFKDRIDFCDNVSNAVIRLHKYSQQNGFCRSPILNGWKHDNEINIALYMYRDWGKGGLLEKFEIKDHPQKKIDYIGDMTVGSMRKYLEWVKRTDLGKCKGQLYFKHWDELTAFDYILHHLDIYDINRNWTKES